MTEEHSDNQKWVPSCKPKSILNRGYHVGIVFVPFRNIRKYQQADCLGLSKLLLGVISKLSLNK